MQNTFLSRILPTLPTPDFFGLSSPTYFSIGLGKQNNIRNQRAAASIDSVAKHCTACSTLGLDAYMALASFTNPLGGRKKDNALECKSIWTDVDCGPGKPYPDAAHGLVALLQFTKATGLTPSIIVSSGKGLHVYWTFSKNISAALWMQTAGLFYQLCKQHGFEVDPARARDISSVLRLPGTVHQSSGRVVQLISDNGKDWHPRDFVAQISKTLNPAAQVLPIPVVNTHLQTSSPVAALMGMGPQPPTAKARPIVENCHQLLTLGFGNYTHRFNAASILRRCTDGLEWAHRLAALNPPKYDPAMTERKFYDAAEDAPARCETFEQANPAICMKCPHRGRLTSPVQLYKMVSTPPAVPIPASPNTTQIDSAIGAILGHQQPLQMSGVRNYPHIPLVSNQFKVDGRGIVQMVAVKDANGNWITEDHVICTSQLWFKYIILKSEEGKPQRSYVFDAIHPNKQVEELRLTIGEDTSEQKIMAWFNNARMFPNGPGYTGKVFMNFINAYLSSVVHTAKELPVVNTFGWSTHKDPVTKQETPGFVVGAGIVTDSGIHPVKYGPTAKQFNDREFDYKGDLEQWKSVPQMYKTLNQPIGMLAMCMSFAAPLMKYGAGEARNGLLSIWSNTSGLGKSHVLRAAHSVWGNPDYAFFSRDESAAARNRRLTVWNNLPAFIDEITDMKDEDMYSMAYSLAGGKEKGKLKSSGAEFVDTGTWSTISITTANKSFKSAISRRAGDSEATLLRVMEYECTFPSYESQPVVQQYISTCMGLYREHYGLAGPEFMHRLLQHSGRLATLTQFAEHWCTRHGFKNKERYMSYALALALQAGRWAVEFGLLDYDMDQLEEWVLKDFVPHNRRYTNDLSPDFTDKLSTYLNSRMPNMLVVRRATRDAIKEIDPGMSNLPDRYLIYRPTGELFARYEQENQELYFAKEDFDAWCNRQHVSPGVLINNLKAGGIYVYALSVSLGAEVSWLSTPRVKCYKLDRHAVETLGFSVVDNPPQQP